MTTIADIHQRFLRALERWHRGGAQSAWDEMLATALSGHSAAARVLLAFALREDHDAPSGTGASVLLEQLLTSASAAPQALVLAAELQRFHPRCALPAALPARWSEALAEAVVQGSEQARHLVLLYGAWAGRAPPEASSPAMLAAWLEQAQEQWRSPAPEQLADRDGVQVTLVRRFAPTMALRQVLETLGERLAPSLVVDPRTGQRIAHPVRSATQAQWLPELLGWGGKLLEERLAVAGAYSRACGEVANLLCYDPGQAYQPHLDCLPPEASESAQGVSQGGQRLLTQLLGVVRADDGGATRFRELELSVVLGPGDLLAFTNATASGAPLVASRHSGEPVLKGRKWLLSKWVRQSKTPYGRELEHCL
ncbi:MAG: 2OG-Fe(II) oxygenase [Pseudomonadota bacterium]